ncbi:MAG: hypothetical protein ABIE74_02585 [Pseudomonadota bacterium]
MRKRIAMVVLALMVAMVAACGGSSSTTSTTPQIASVKDLPRATGPVAGTTANVAAKGVVVTKAASTGMRLGNTTGADFGANSSMAACQAFNGIREAVRSASQADMILCYIQNLVGTNTQIGTVDPYDGEYHVFDLSITGDQEAPDKIKMKITKTGGVVTGFEMFACTAGTQNEYVNQAITGSNVNMVSKGNFADANWTGSHQVAVAGALNETGMYTSKTIETKNSGADRSTPPNSNWSEYTTIQSSTQWTTYGYDRGNWSDNGFQGSYSNASYSEMQLIDGNPATATNENYNLTLLALGDGATLYNMESVHQGGTWESGETSEGWNGDTRLPDPTVSYLTNVQGQDLVTPGTAPTIVFDTAQTWDCSGTAEGTVSGDSTTLDTACAQYGTMGGDNWINCWEVIENA